MIHPQTGDRTWIDEAADRFESDWKRGGDRPRIEDFLAGRSEPGRTVLLQELLRVECELRKTAGETALSDEYRQRFPDDAAAIDAVFGIDAHRSKPSTEPPIATANSLLFGLLALQNNFIDRETLLAAFNAWVADKSQSMGQILLDRGALNPARHAVLQVLVQEHLQQHGFDPERSLAVLTVGPAVRDDLEELPDFDLQASLLYLRLAATDAEEDIDGERTTDWAGDSAATDSEGRFRIVRFHDRGALGEVYVARDQQLHRIVALKRIKRDHATDQDKRARFVVEAEITGRLEHPGIVPVYGLGTYDDGRPFYAMRFIRGDNLKSAIEQFHQAEEKGREPGERALALLKLLRRFLDVCNAIDYAHSRGVLHRDLKPGNIMLGKFGETLVVDWGLAKSVGRNESAPASAALDDRTLVPESGSDLSGTEVGARLGTPAYMSPEQAAGRIDALGPASDVYSLGATLYCLLTGRAPFNDPNLAELLKKVERGDFSRPRKLEPWIDPALEAICLKAMTTEPAERYRTPRALADDVEHWLADEPVSAWREPPRRRLRRWARRHRLLMTSLAATTVVAVAGLAAGNVLVARQRDRAERNLAFARTVVDEMYTGVADKLDEQPQMDEYQREILEKALAFYERFALPQTRDAQMRLEAARAGMRVGGIRCRLGRIAAAEEAYRQALGVLTGLVTGHPSEPLYRDALAQAHREMGTVYRDEERWSESESELKEAAALWDALARATPEIAEYRSKLADAHARLGDQYQIRRGVEEAEAELRQAMDIADRLAREQPGVSAYQESLATVFRAHSALRFNRRQDLPGAIASRARALEIMEKLARDHPEATKYQLALGKDLGIQGYAFAVSRTFVQAEAAVKRSISILERLAADHPQDTNIAASLGKTYDWMSACFRLAGDHQSALEWSGREIQVLRLLARRDPRNVWIGRRQLWIALAGRAEALTRLGRHTEALADFEEVLELSHGTKDVELFRAFHALCKAHLGDLSALAHWGDEVRDTLKVGAGYVQGSPYYYIMFYYDAACAHASMAKLVLQDQRIPPAARQELAQRDIGRALEFLDKSRATGEFKEVVKLDEVRREPLLDPLRTDPRFQRLLMDLAFPDSPFGPLPDQDKKPALSR
jgi:eukaryotic-like serine/threonine-protein kinase